MARKTIGTVIMCLGVLLGGFTIYLTAWKGVWIAITLLPAGFVIALAGISLIRDEPFSETFKNFLENLTW